MNRYDQFFITSCDVVLLCFYFQQIIKIDRNTRHNQDHITALKQEESALKTAIAKEDQYIDKMESVLEIVNKLTDPTQGLSLGQVAHMFTHLQVICSEIFIQ